MLRRAFGQGLDRAGRIGKVSDMDWAKITKVCANLIGCTLLGLTGTAFGGEIFQYVSGSSSLPIDLDWFLVILTSLPSLSSGGLVSGSAVLPSVPDIYSYLSSLTLPAGASIQDVLCTSDVSCWVSVLLPTLSGTDYDFITGLGNVLSGIDYTSLPSVSGISSSIVTTPEPSSLVLLISAVAGGSFLHQHRRARRMAKAARLAATAPLAAAI